MKTTILSLIALLALTTSNAQTTNSGGGQYPENETLKIRYVGYNQGNHVFRLINKLDCETQVTTKVDLLPAKDTVIAAKDSIEYKETRPSQYTQIKFKAKVRSTCNNAERHWIEFTAPVSQTLPLYEDGSEYLRERKEIKVFLIGNNLLNITTSDNKIYQVTVQETDINGRVLYTLYTKMRKYVSILLRQGSSIGITYLSITVSSTYPHNFLYTRQIQSR